MADQTLSASLWYNTQRLASLVDDLYKTVIDPLNLTVIEWHILHTLYRQDGQRANDLAHAVGRAPTAFTATLDRLEQKDWISRQPDPKDRRVVRMYLTDHAHHFRPQFDESVATLETQLRALVSKRDLNNLTRLLQHLPTSHSP